MKRNKHPTWTTLALEHLTRCDDLVTTHQLAAVTGATINQMQAALAHLRRHRAVDVIVEPNGVAWWFATPTSDTRCRHNDERVIEMKPRRRRAYRVRVTSKRGA